MDSFQKKFLLFLTTYAAILITLWFEGINVNPAGAGEILGSIIILPLILGKWLKVKGKIFIEYAIFYASILFSFFIGFPPTGDAKYEFGVLIIIFTCVLFFPLNYLFSKIIASKESKKNK